MLKNGMNNLIFFTKKSDLFSRSWVPCAMISLVAMCLRLIDYSRSNAFVKCVGNVKLWVHVGLMISDDQKLKEVSISRYWVIFLVYEYVVSVMPITTHVTRYLHCYNLSTKYMMHVLSINTFSADCYLGHADVYWLRLFFFHSRAF